MRTNSTANGIEEIASLTTAPGTTTTITTTSPARAQGTVSILKSALSDDPTVGHHLSTTILSFVIPAESTTMMSPGLHAPARPPARPLLSMSAIVVS